MQSQYLDAAKRAFSSWQSVNALLVADATVLTNAVLLKSHAAERAGGGDHCRADGARLRAATLAVAQARSGAQRRLEELFAGFVGLQAALQSFLGEVGRGASATARAATGAARGRSAAGAEESELGSDPDAAGAEAERRSARCAEIAGELLSLFAAELALKQSILTGLMPADCGCGPGCDGRCAVEEGARVCGSGAEAAQPRTYVAEFGLPPGAENDRERMLVSVSAIAAEAYVDAARVQALLDGLSFLAR